MKVALDSRLISFLSLIGEGSGGMGRPSLSRAGGFGALTGGGRCVVRSVEMFGNGKASIRSCKRRARVPGDGVSGGWLVDEGTEEGTEELTESSFSTNSATILNIFA